MSPVSTKIFHWIKWKGTAFLQSLLDAGGSGEIRTRDQRIKSPLLYRLSYRPGKPKIIARSLWVFLEAEPSARKPLYLQVRYEFTRLATGGFLEKYSLIPLKMASAIRSW